MSISLTHADESLVTNTTKQAFGCHIWGGRLQILAWRQFPHWHLLAACDHFAGPGGFRRRKPEGFAGVTAFRGTTTNSNARGTPSRPLLSCLCAEALGAEMIRLIW